jgi:hypothetical protein
LKFEGYVGEDFYSNVLMFGKYQLGFFEISYIIDNEISAKFFLDWYELAVICENQITIIYYNQLRNLFHDKENTKMFHKSLLKSVKTDKETDLKRIKSTLADAKNEFLNCIK